MPENLDFLGPEIPSGLVMDHVLSKINPVTKKPYSEAERPKNLNVFPHIKATSSDSIRGQENVQKKPRNLTIDSYFEKAVVAKVGEKRSKEKSPFAMSKRAAFATKPNPEGNAANEGKNVVLQSSRHFSVPSTSSSKKNTTSILNRPRQKFLTSSSFFAKAVRK